MDLVKKKYHEDVLHDVFKKVVWETYRGAATEQKVQAIGDPRITQTNLNDWEDGKSLEYTAEFDLLPEANVKKYKGLSITEHSSEIKDEDVNIVLKGLLEPHAELSVLPESTTVARGHVITLDFIGSLDGKELADATARNFFMEVGGKNSLESFQEGVIGLRAGQTKQIQVDYPADFTNAEIAGKSVSYDVTVHEIKEKKFPELTDELAKEFQADSKDELLKRVRTSLEQELKVENDQNQREQAIVAFLEANPLEVPESLVQRQLQFIMQDVGQLLKRQRFGDNMIQDYLAKNWKDLKTRAEKEVKLALLLPKVVEAEKIEATNEDLKAYLQEGAGRAGNPKIEDLEKQYLDNAEHKSDLQREVQRQKAIRFLVQNAKIRK
jgi:trigger factor